MGKLKAVNVRLPVGLVKLLKSYVKQTGRNNQNVIAEALANYLRKMGDVGLDVGLNKK